MQPLSDVHVVDVTQNVAGPFCTQILADLGADVIKIEPFAGDSTRLWGPPFWHGESTMYLAFNRGKRSVALDIGKPEARQILDHLLQRADVLVQSLRPPAARKLQLDNESLTEIYPDLIPCALSGFSPAGAMKDHPGFDPLMQAFTGLMSITGEPQGNPTRVGTSIVDMATGMWAALGVVSALLARLRSGTSPKVATSLFESAIAWLPYQIIGYLASGARPMRWGTELAMLVPYGAYQARDGFLVIAVGTESLWVRLCGALDRPDLVADSRYASNPSRVENRETLRVALEEVLAKKTVEDWVVILEQAGIPASPINEIPDVVEHPEMQASRMLQSANHPMIPDLELLRSPVSLDGRHSYSEFPPPLQGEHTVEVLVELGLSVERIQQLIAEEIIQTAGIEDVRSG